jgi:hypothetical protein
MDARIVDLREIWWEDVDWIHLAHDMNDGQALANAVTNNPNPVS